MGSETVDASIIWQRKQKKTQRNTKPYHFESRFRIDLIVSKPTQSNYTPTPTHPFEVDFTNFLSFEKNLYKKNQT